jgi:hypothetical protein
MRKEMSRLSSGVFFGFGCFTGSGVLRPMAACRAAARHRQPRAALAPTSQRCRVGRVREALVCLIFESRLRPGFSEPGFLATQSRSGFRGPIHFSRQEYSQMVITQRCGFYPCIPLGYR